MTQPRFEAFFRAVHGHDPFPWQVRAAQRLCARETFAVAVPTGLGKSALVDAAVWAAAHGAWRRIVFVVDRRIIVDAVHERALRIVQWLAEPCDPALQALRDRLGQLQVVRLRGGVFGDDDWVLYPERVTIALTTVDQLGSRLLFRGYGVSARRWPLHAGFFASGSLVIVDEAHLVNPFLQTLQTLRQQGADLALVPMSATLRDDPSRPLVTLDHHDLALPCVHRRLHARKLVRLTQAGPAEKDFVNELLAQAKGLAREPGVTRVAVVVNRVATARRVFDRLTAEGVETALLTGRVRPADRDRTLGALLPLLQSGRSRSADDRLLVVVATQTIEVGADLDFDALVTESAPLSALRQRFGRVDRLGQRAASAGVIVHRRATDRDDPVYGQPLAAAWAWLCARAGEEGGSLDFGIAALDALLVRQPCPAEPEHHAASLLPTHVEMLAQTGPFAPQLELGAWLHGPTGRAPDVTLVWRDDLDAEDTAGWTQALTLLPPMTRESLPMPVAAVRRWLAGARLDEGWGDAAASADDGDVGTASDRPVLRWRGADDCEVIAAGQIRPGDTIVLPSAYGGCDDWGWAPEATQPVTDIADTCLAERIESATTRRIVLRLTEGHWPAFGAAAPELRALVDDLVALQRQAQTSDDGLELELEEGRQRLLDALKGSAHPLTASLREPSLEPHPKGIVVRGLGTEEVEGVVETGRAVALDDHHDDVARWAKRLTAGDPHEKEIVAAAAVHDAGKAEPRMQAMLHGSAVAAAAGPLLAKSALRRRDEQMAAWRASRLPRGFRHEFASLDMAEGVKDPLVRHLTATHHGYGRPWLPPCDDSHAAGARHARLDAHWLQAWNAALREHGPWALARMEWLLRAADARASMQEAGVDAGVDDGSR